MATVTRSNIGNLHDKISVKLTKEDYMPTFEKSLKQYAKSANIPGFRKGMVPTGMVRKMYGQALFNDEVLRAAGNELEKYMIESKLEIFAQPMVMPNETPLALNMNAPEDVDMDFEIGLRPDFEIPALKKATALKKYKVELSENMMTDEIEKIRKRYGKVEEMTEVSGEGDIIYSTFEPLDADGNEIEGSEKKDDTEVFEKMPLGLQTELKGKKPGDSITFVPAKICTPEELEAFMKDPLKAGIEAADFSFKMTLTKVGVLQPADLDTNLYVQLFPNDDIKDEAEFTARLKDELGKEFSRMSEERLNNEIYEYLVHNTTIEMPVDFLKRWLREGQEKKKTAEEVENDFPGFEHQLRWQLISDKLIADNKIQVSQDDVMSDIKQRVLSYFGMQTEEDAPWMEEYMQKVAKDEKTLDETYRRLLFDKLFNHLHAAFEIKEETITEDEFFKLADPHALHHHH